MLATYSGWLAAGLIVLAGSVPLLVRWRRGKRADPTSKPLTIHADLGLAGAGAAFLHTLLSLFALGEPEVVAVGDLALLFGAAAFVVLLAHTGLGFQLRNPKLRKRRDVRRQHWITATSILITVGIHAAMFLTV